jgi:hypothetical protein
MITDNFETDLREALSRCASEVPTHVGERLRQQDYHPRGPHRQLASGLAATVVLAGVTAALVEITTSGSGPSRSAVQPTGRSKPPYRLDAKMVAYRSHIAVESSSITFSYSHSVTTNATGVVTGSNDSWRDGSMDRIEAYGADGSPVFEVWHSATGDGTSRTTTVETIDFVDEEYSVQSGIPTTEDTSPTQPQPYDQLNQAIANGEFTESGPTTVNGVQAIGLTGGNEQIWVDSTTFLPVRWVTTTSTGTNTDNLIWGQPTAADLASLSQPTVPSGFTQVTHASIPPAGATAPPSTGSNTN